MTTSKRGRAEACANIALAKYWGKSGRGDNLTATSSLSLTLDGLHTRTEVALDESLAEDEVILAGSLLSGRGRERVTALLDRFRARTGKRTFARVTTENDFPTAAGLASSASGFAALAVAADAAFQTSLGAVKLSSIARQSSASAGRSLYGGYVELARETDAATVVAPGSHFPLSMVVAVVTAQEKPISSTGGMLHTEKTSPYYPAWLDVSESVFESVKVGILERDFERVANGMEHSARLMHATMMTSVPPVIYLRGATVELMHEVAARRGRGEPVAYTMDAGPNVKVLTTPEHEATLVSWLRGFPGVSNVIVCRPGPAAAVLSLDGSLGAAARVQEVQ